MAFEFRSLARQYKRQPFDINSLTPNRDACETFGGCPYRASNGGPCKDSRTLGEMFKMTQPNGGMTDVEAMLAQRAAQGGQPMGPPPGYQPPQGGPPPQQNWQPPQPPQQQWQQPPQNQQPGAYPAPPGGPPPQPPGMPGIPNGYGAPQPGQMMPPPQTGWAPPGPPGGMGYQPPQAPHLPPEAQRQYQPQPPQMNQAAGQQPQLPGVPPQLPPAGAAAQEPKKRGRKPKAVVPATQGVDEETQDERSAFMTLFVVEHFRGMALQIDPNHAQALTRNATSLANLAWIALQEAGC